MQPIPPQVLEGRNPWWREAWEELPASDRSAVKEAWNEGPQRSTASLHLRPHRHRGAASALGLASVGWSGLLIGVWGYLTCFRTPSAFCWFYGAMTIVWVAALPTRLILGRRRVKRAEAANLAGPRPNPEWPATAMRIQRDYSLRDG
jgi:hypothetical protein